MGCEREPTHGVWHARQGLVPEKKVFEVHIEQGHKHGAKVVLRGEAGCSDPNVQPGDVVFVLEQRTHKHFKRIGNDLILEKVRCASRLPHHNYFYLSAPAHQARQQTPDPEEGALARRPVRMLAITDAGFVLEQRTHTTAHLI